MNITDNQALGQVYLYVNEEKLSKITTLYPGEIWEEGGTRYRATHVSLRAEDGEIAVERSHATASVANVVELGLGNVCHNVFARLDEAPKRPHRMGRRAPRAHGLLERDELALARRGG